jgi:hypothetical protein
MAYKDHNMDVCEAAYQLACDAVENRYKLTLPLDRSVLLCESHVTHETSSKKGSNECEVQVRKDSILAPSSLYQGKWILNGDYLSYHQNIMQEGTLIQVFSTSSKDEEPIAPALARTRSTPLPNSKLKTDKSGLFDFRSPELERNRDLFKQMILGAEELDDFGDEAMEQLAREYQRSAGVEQNDEDSAASGDGQGEVEDKAEPEIRLVGTHKATLKNQEGIHQSYKGAVTYDPIYKKYYVLVLADQHRYVAVVSDLHRFSEHFQKIEGHELVEGRDAGEIQKIVDIVPSSMNSAQDFQKLSLKVLLEMERDRFNLPWRWSQWSNLFAHAINFKRLRDQQEAELVHQQLPPPVASLKKPEGGDGLTAEQ